MGWLNLVALELGHFCRVPIVAHAHCGRVDYAAVQQVHAIARRIIARASIRFGQENRIPNAQHRRDGWQQALSSFECVLYRVRTPAEDRSFRYVGSAIDGVRTRSRARARNWSLS